MVKVFCPTKVVSPDIADDSSDLFFDENMLEIATLEAPDGTSALSFLDDLELSVVSPGCLERSRITLPSKTSSLGKATF